MRIHLYVAFTFTVTFTFLVSTTYAMAAKTCRSYLSPTTETLNDNKDDVISLLHKTSFVKPLESHDVVIKAERIVDLAVEAKLLNKPEARHLRSDLEALKAERNFKEDHPTFKDILGQWVTFIEHLEPKLQEFKSMPPAEQKAWKSKMELPVYFATAHFIVFLETKNNKNFDYAKMTTLLKIARGEEILSGDIKLYLYAFEKQVRRYFSTKEFRRCRA